MFDEYVSAVRFDNMVKEMRIKLSLYNVFGKMAQVKGERKLDLLIVQHTTTNNEIDKLYNAYRTGVKSTLLLE